MRCIELPKSKSPCVFYYEGSESKTHIMPLPCTGIIIINDNEFSDLDTYDLKININGIVQTLKASEILKLKYSQFANLTITANGPYRLWVTK